MTQSSRWAIGGGRIRFPDISPRAYEHPADRGALVALRAIPGFDAVLKAVSAAIGERSVRLLFLASAIRVSPRQYPLLHQMLNECATALDVQPVPELYVQQSPLPTAMTVGLDRPLIVISTGMLDLVDDDGLRFVIGHEVGHVLSGHAVYRTMLLQLINIATSIQWMPIGYWGIRAIIQGLNEWYRKSELSCDRAGLLCGQDPKAALRVHASLAGAQNPDEMDVAGFLDQADGVHDHRRRPRQPAQDRADQRPDPPAGRAARRRAAEVGGRPGVPGDPGRRATRGAPRTPTPR